MKTLNSLFVYAISFLFLTSCGHDEIHPADVNNSVTLEQLLGSYDLWYVDLESTLGDGQTVFVEMAFTLSFLNGSIYANNNLVGFGERGNGFGIYVGVYDANGIVLDVNHALDGHQRFEVYQVSISSIELYSPINDTSYFLRGFQRSTFDYDAIFFENIDYFLQEYRAWENSLTTAEGAETAFDDENYLFFYSEGGQALFKSSIDENIANANQIQWDYTGAYSVEDIIGGGTKRLTLNYAFNGSDYFELSVIDDETIKLYHPISEKTYVYSGRNYIAFMRTIQSDKQGVKNQKLRPQKTKRQENKRSQHRASELLYFINS